MDVCWICIGARRRGMPEARAAGRLCARHALPSTPRIATSRSAQARAGAVRRPQPRAGAYRQRQAR